MSLFVFEIVILEFELFSLINSTKHPSLPHFPNTVSFQTSSSSFYINMIIPIRCFTCGKVKTSWYGINNQVVGNKWEAYLHYLNDENMDPAYVFLMITGF